MWRLLAGLVVLHLWDYLIIRLFCRPTRQVDTLFEESGRQVTVICLMPLCMDGSLKRYAGTQRLVACNQCLFLPLTLSHGLSHLNWSLYCYPYSRLLLHRVLQRVSWLFGVRETTWVSTFSERVRFQWWLDFGVLATLVCQLLLELLQNLLVKAGWLQLAQIVLLVHATCRSSASQLVCFKCLSREAYTNTMVGPVSTSHCSIKRY